MQFLDQINFNADKKQRENMLDFSHLCLLDDEQDEDGQFNASLQPTAADEKLCKACFENEANCFMEPCCHVYYCMECYEKWKNVDPAVFDLDLEPGDEQALVSTEPLQDPRCPICREIIESAKKLRFC